MTENGSMSIEVVRGEMQPWSDYTSSEPAASGPALLALLSDVLADAAPASGNALLIGPHDGAVIDAVADRSGQVTVLVRSVSDAERIAAELAAKPSGNVTVVAGALDGFELAAHGAFDLVVAADGLDRTLGADSVDLDWPQRLAIVAGLATEASLVIVACQNEASLLNLLDRRPASERHGDDEWRPIYQDPRRPASPSQFVTALSAGGLTPAAVYATFGRLGDPQTLIDLEAAAAVTPGTLSASLAAAALESAGTPLLAPVTDGLDNVIRAGLLGAMAPGWLAVCGAHGRTLYGRIPGSTAVVAADLDSADHTWRIELTDTASAEESATSVGEAAGEQAVAVSMAVLPATVPDAESVEQVLFRLAAAEDVPAFRSVAGRIGDWMRRQSELEPDRIVCLDDLFVDGDGFALGTAALVATMPERSSDLRAATWYRFQDRLLRAHRRHPWPPWAIGDDLVTIWLGMAGWSGADNATPDGLAVRGRELADAVAVVIGGPAAGPEAPGDPAADLRTALADAAAARTELFELTGHVAGLERALGHRDRQLKARAKVIHDQRQDLVQMRGYRVHQAMKLARKAGRIRDPRAFAEAVMRRILK